MPAVADVRIIQPENPQYNADGAALQKYVKDMKGLSDKVGTTPDADPNAKLEGLGVVSRLYWGRFDGCNLRRTDLDEHLVGSLAF